MVPPIVNVMIIIDHMLWLGKLMTNYVQQILNLHTGWSMSTWRMEHKTVCSSKQVGFALLPIKFYLMTSNLEAVMDQSNIHYLFVQVAILHFNGSDASLSHFNGGSSTMLKILFIFMPLNSFPS